MRLIPTRAAAGAALLAAVLAAAPALTPASAAPAQAAPVARAEHAGAGLSAGAVAACPAPAPGHAACTLITAAAGTPAAARAHVQGGTRAAAASTPAGLEPSNLQATYKLQSLTSGMRQIVAFIAAGADPTAEADLAAYRSQWGLPPCTTSDGCLKIENQSGGSTLPTTVFNGWPGNDALGLDTISAVCPNCHLLLIEANSTAISDLAVAANTAATTSGVHYVDNAYAGPEFSTETSFDTDYNHPGVAMVAAAGDTGYSGTINYPAASPGVVSAGGTVLTQASGTWTDTSAWSGTVSGCSLYESAKPAWQHDTGCAGRTDNDIAAAAATSTSGVVNPLFIAYYNTSNGGTGWTEGGGTTASASLITGIYALAGTPAASNPAAYPYQNGTYDLTDITTGSTGTCSITYLCTAGTSYDAPTGMGTPNGVQSLTSAGHTTGAIYGDGFAVCLDNSNGTFTAGNKIDVWTCNGGNNTQKWNVKSDGTIKINGDTAFCIGVHNGSTADGASVALRSCGGTTDEQWRALANGELLNQKSGKCVEDPSSGTNGTQLVIEPCTGSTNQRWDYLTAAPASTGEIKIQSDTSLCMDNSGGVLAANNPVIFATCNGGTDTQEWTLTSNGEINIGSSWCVTADIGVTQIQKCNTDPIQIWIAESNGFLYNINRNSCLERLNTDQNVFWVTPCTATSNEQWLLP